MMKKKIPLFLCAGFYCFTGFPGFAAAEPSKKMNETAAAFVVPVPVKAPRAAEKPAADQPGEMGQKAKTAQILPVAAGKSKVLERATPEEEAEAPPAVADDGNALEMAAPEREAQMPPSAAGEKAGTRSAPLPAGDEESAADKKAAADENDEISRYCRNIGSRVRDLRFELQMRQLNGLRSQLEARITVLEEKRKGYEEWLAKRNDFMARSQDSFVGIISKMQPDAAAAQLSLLDPMAAASIILKLQTKVSSAIMNELQPEKSAALMRVLVTMQKEPDEQHAKNEAAAQKGGTPR